MSQKPPGEHPADVWERFCEELKRAGQILRRAQTPQDELTQAEGLRFLARMLRIGFENGCEIADPSRPRLIPMVEPPLKVYEGVTGDARYLHAFIDGERTYRIRGTRGQAPLMEFSVYTGKGAIHEHSLHLGALTERDFELGDDGTIEVVLSPSTQPGNWIRTGPETHYTMVRQYAHDWTGLEPAFLSIEVDGAPERPAPLTLPQITQGLSATAEFVSRAPVFWSAISDYWEGFAVNRFVAQLSADEQTDIGAPIGHHFSCGWFRLEPDQALRVAFRPDEVPYWSLGLANYWYETLGYGEGGSEINNRTARIEPDGTVRAVVCDGPPRDTNWLDTRGHREGTLIFRWSRSPDPVPPIETQLVRLDELDSHSSSGE